MFSALQETKVGTSAGCEAGSFRFSCVLINPRQHGSLNLKTTCGHDSNTASLCHLLRSFVTEALLSDCYVQGQEANVYISQPLPIHYSCPSSRKSSGMPGSPRKVHPPSLGFGAESVAILGTGAPQHPYNQDLTSV